MVNYKRMMNLRRGKNHNLNLIFFVVKPCHFDPAKLKAIADLTSVCQIRDRKNRIFIARIDSRYLAHEQVTC